MKDEINKIIQSISDFYKLDNALKYYLDRHKAQILLDYITNLQEENERLNNIIDAKDYKIKRLVYSCYESDMSYGEFKAIWVNAFEKLYDPKDIDKLEKELQGVDKE